MLASSAPNWWGTAYQYNAFIEMVPLPDAGRATGPDRPPGAGGYQVVFRRGAYLVLHRPLDQLVLQQRRGQK